MPLAEQRGGAELMLLHLLRAQCDPAGGAPGIEYCVAFLEDGPMVEEVRALGVEATVVPAGRLSQPDRLLASHRALHRWFRRRRAGLAMSWMPKAHLYAAPAALLAGIPTVWWQHTIPDRRHRMTRYATTLPARAVLCCSAASAAAQQRIRPGRRCRVVYPAVDLGRFDRDALPGVKDARVALGLDPEARWIGFVGRLQRWKGVHVFVDAAARVQRARPDVRFALVGGQHFSEPDYPALLRARARQQGLGERFRFAGQQSDVRLWMQAMDIGVHASVAPEPFGMVVPEFMALGKPVVAAAAGGPLEVITPGRDGFLTPPRDPEALATTLLALLDDPERAARVGARARERARDFGSGRLARDTGAELRRVVG